MLCAACIKRRLLRHGIGSVLHGLRLCLRAKHLIQPRQHVTGEVAKQLFLRAGIAAQIDFSRCRAQDFFRAPDGGSWL